MVCIYEQNLIKQGISFSNTGEQQRLIQAHKIKIKIKQNFNPLHARSKTQTLKAIKN